MAAIKRRFDPLGESVLKVVVTHHPFDLPDQPGDVDLVGRAREAMAVFSRCGVDLLLSGHFHVSQAGSTAGAARDRRLFGARRPGRHGDLDARPRRGELVQRPARSATTRSSSSGCRGATDAKAFAPTRTERFVRDGARWIECADRPRAQRSASWSCSSRHMTLPEPDFGRASTNWTILGTL